MQNVAEKTTLHLNATARRGLHAPLHRRYPVMSSIDFAPDTPPVDDGRRRLLVVASSAMTAIGLAAVTIPFIRSMGPSQKAKTAGASVKVDFSKLEIGQQITLEWRGKPVWILRRSEEMLRLMEAPQHRQRLRDPDSAELAQQPDYARNATRSINAEYFVVIGICTHLGCVPNFRPEVAPEDLGPEWVGGYFCPCHGSRFDLAGRVYSGVPAPTNLVVPPYHFHTTTVIEIGIDYEDAMQGGKG